MDVTDDVFLKAEDVEYLACIALSRRSVGEGSFMVAVDHARSAVGIDPSRPEACNLLGACFEIRRAPLEAQKFYRAALALDPSFGSAQRNLHCLVSYHKRGQVDLGK